MAGRLQDELGTGLAGLALGLGIVAILVAIWLAVKAAELVIRVMVAHPNNKAMWLALGVLVLAVLAVVISGGQFPFLNAMPLAALAALVVTARVVELSHDQLLQRQWSLEAVAHEVLHEPWWNVA